MNNVSFASPLFEDFVPGFKRTDVYSDYRQLRHMGDSTDSDVGSNGLALIGASRPSSRFTRGLSDTAAAVFTPAYSALRRVIGEKPYNWRFEDEPSAVISKNGFKSFEMPAKKKSKSTKGRPRRRPRTRKPQARRVSNNPLVRAAGRGERKNPRGSMIFKSVVKRTSMPPTAIGRTTREGPRMSMSTRMNNYRLRFRTFFDNVALQYAAVTGNADVVLYDNATGDAYTGVVIAPQYNYYTIAQINNIAQCFEQFKVHNMTFEYEPRAATNVNGQLSLASVQDVEYPEVHNMTNSVTGDFLNPMPLPQLKSVENVKSGPLWDSHFFPIKVDRRWKYCTDPYESHSHIDFNTVIAADARQCYAGCILFGGNGNGNVSLAGTYLIVGDMYQTWDVEFKGFGSLVTHGTSLMSTVQKIARSIKSLQETESKSKTSPTPSWETQVDHDFLERKEKIKATSRPTSVIGGERPKSSSLK